MTSKTTFALADAQHLIARAHGFPNWSAFVSHIEDIAGSDPAARAFEDAADAVVEGDAAALAALIRARPALIHARSTREHRVTLLHYVAANGVEDFRQKTPPNAVEIARMLLEAGAEPDAIAGTYGGDNYQTTMNLLVSSVHPAMRGVQSTLAETLLDFGAAINGVDDDESPIMTALAFGYIDAAETLARRGARVDTVLTAAALGDAELVESMVIEGGTLRPRVPLVAPTWLGLPRDPKSHAALALVWASRFGRAAVVKQLLDKGVDPAAHDTMSMTALHWAAGHGHLDVVSMLLRFHPPLEATNQWGGTVLDSTVYLAVNDPSRGVDYVPVIELLLAAGADARAVTPFPTGDPRLDEVLRRSQGRRP